MVREVFVDPLERTGCGSRCPFVGDRVASWDELSHDLLSFARLDGGRFLSRAPRSVIVPRVRKGRASRSRGLTHQERMLLTICGSLLSVEQSVRNQGEDAWSG